MNVLLIEDEQKIADFICAGLSARGMSLTHCNNGQEGLMRATQGHFDAVVLDLMLPGLDGLAVLQAMRSDGVTTPVILLSARNELSDRVQGLNLGADDYLAKPFFVEELAARLQALVRRLSGERQNTVQVGPVLLDRITRQAVCRGQVIELTAREFSLLEILMRSAGQVFTRSQLLEQVWGYDFDPSTNVVDVCIKRIRTKMAALDAGDDAPSLIEAVRGVGYRCRASS